MRKERRVWENGLETAWIGQLRPHVGPRRRRSCLAAVDNRPGLGSETAAALEKEEEEEVQDVKRM